MGCHFLLQGIFPTQKPNLSLWHLLHWQSDSLSLNHLGSPSAYKPGDDCIFIHLSTHPSIYPFTSFQLTAMVLTQAASTFLLGGFNSHFTALGALLTAPSSQHHFHSQSQPEWFFCNVDLTMILLCLQAHQMLPMALRSLTFLA